MAGLVPAIPIRRHRALLNEMPGTSPGMTKERAEFVILLSFRGASFAREPGIQGWNEAP